MNKTLSKILIALMLFLVPELSSGQVITLGSASDFVLFTTVGAITNSGTGYLTHLTGKVGSNSGSSTGFGNVDGTMHSGDAFTIAAAANLTTAYNQLNTAIPTAFPSSALGGGTIMNAGVYSIPSSATLTGTLTLDGQGNPGAVFIFQINGALSTGANAKVKLVNGALACNVYWKTEGLTSLASGTTIRGTIVAHNAAISMGTADTLEGRALSINGAITLNSLTAATPIGCGSPTLTGPTAPTLGAVSGYAIFSSNGPVSNGGAISYVTGDIGTNLGLTTNYDPLYVHGMIHPIPDVSTGLAAPALSVAYNQLNALPNDIELLYPAIFGHSLVLTPHTYLLNAATSLTDTVYLNAQGNNNAVFVMNVVGQLSVLSNAVVILMNGTQSKNVYWKVEGAVSLGSNSIFNGNIIAHNGAIDILPGAQLYGRALSTTGAITTDGNIINAPLFPNAVITGDSTVCVGSSILLIGTDPGGVWSVINPNASVTNTGIVTGISAGLDSVIYTVTNSFGTSRAAKAITVNPLPDAGTISGPSGVCVGSTILLTNPSAGGIWSAANPTATVINGFVTGISPGANTITYTVANTCGSAATTKNITIYAIPDVAAPANQTACNGAPTAAVNFTGTVSGTTFTWTNSNTGIGLAGSGTGNIPSFTALNGSNAPMAANITVTPSANGCTGASQTFTITVNPTPNTATVANQTVCNGAATTAITYTGTVGGTTFTWTNDNAGIGLANSGTGNIPSFTALNSSNAPMVANIIATPSANGCTGASKNSTITVNPTPDAATVANQTVCNGAPTTAVNFTGTVSGTSFTWTNNNAGIGLANAGSGNIPSFNAQNSSNAPTVANITVTPSANGCTGTSKSFAITVNPTPNTATVANQTVCNGAPTTPITYTGTVSGTTFAWTNDNTTIGLAGTGNGNIPSFTATNNTSAPTVANIIATPSANGCTGASKSSSITVNPTPNAAAVTNQTLCNGALTTAVNYTGTVSGTSFTWTNNNTSIGLAGSGTGNIPAFTALNGASTPNVANITVTPSANGCTGASRSFTITVNPTPDAATVANQAVCNGAPTTAVNFTGTVSGTTFTWTNSNTTIGLTGAGTGNINPFAALNNTNAPTTGNITVTPSANGCTGASKGFTITVNPTPDVATVANRVVCNGAPTAAVNFTGTVSGTTFTWSNNNTGIGLSSAGVGNIPSFIAVNNTSTTAVAIVSVDPSANGCSGTFKSFTITVNPTPNTTTVADLAVCNGLPTAPVNFTGTVGGTVFAWTNDNTTIGLTGTGAGNIPSFTALNSTNTPVVAKINVTPTANGCDGLTTGFTITVNNTPAAPVIALTTPPSVCNMTYFRNFGAATLPPAGVNYTWSTINGAVSDTGSTQQYALINFKKTGMTTVILTATVANTGCLNTANYKVDVTGNVADAPAQVIYFNKSFVCLQNNEEAYSWGYDDASTLAPTLIKGELNQDYVNATPNLDANRYWVMVTHNGCIQKTYYNKPAGALMKMAKTEISVSPNPAGQQIKLSVNAAGTGDTRMEIYNTLGNRMYAANSVGAITTVDVAAFPAGVYMIVCYSNGEKITARFVKN